MQDGGILGMHKHERLLSRTSSGRPAKKRAAGRVRGAAGDLPSPQDNGQRLHDAGAAAHGGTGGRQGFALQYYCVSNL